MQRSGVYLLLLLLAATSVCVGEEDGGPNQVELSNHVSQKNVGGGSGTVTVITNNDGVVTKFTRAKNGDNVKIVNGKLVTEGEEGEEGEAKEEEEDVEGAKKKSNSSRERKKNKEKSDKEKEKEEKAKEDEEYLKEPLSFPGMDAKEEIAKYGRWVHCLCKSTISFNIFCAPGSWT